MDKSLKYSLTIIFLLQITLGQILAQELPFQNISLDHVTIAVKDLESFEDFFSNLGFTIKPGTQHENSIQNAHIKFENNTSIELLTATKKRDEISAWYVDRINNYPEGSGVYVALKVDSSNTMDDIKRVFLRKSILFREHNLKYSQIISFHTSLPWHSIFFIHYLNDDKEIIQYTNHVNGVLKIESVSVNIDNSLQDSDIFESAIKLTNCDILFSDFKEADRVATIELKIKDSKLMKEYFRKVDRKKFVERIDYEKGKIKLLTKFNMLFIFTE